MSNQTSHTLRGCVDWNSNKEVDIGDYSGHTLRGCVDWNFRIIIANNLFIVTPFVGVWIETVGSRICLENLVVTPFVGVWIETLPKAKSMKTGK